MTRYGLCGNESGADRVASFVEGQAMHQEPGAVHQLVVIGSSAGGVEALSTLVSTLPLNFPAPIVIAQHLDRSRASHLQDILARRTALPVRTVTDEDALEACVIYVVPADRDVEITNH